MFSNYFYLLRSVIELKQDLIGTTIESIYSQEKNILSLSIPSIQNPNRHLHLSTDSRNIYLVVKSQHRAKRNVVEFFRSIVPSTIQDIQIASNDRIIKISLINNYSLVFVKTNTTNVYLLNSNDILEEFKNPQKVSKIDFSQTKFISSLKDFFDDKLNEFSNLRVLKSAFPMISNEIKKEIDIRNSEANNLINTFELVTHEIVEDKIRVGFNTQLDKIIFVPQTFKSIPFDGTEKIFNKYNDALLERIYSGFKSSNLNRYKKDLEKYFDKELTHLSIKLNKLKIRIEKGSKENLYYKMANSLLANINSLEKGMKSISLVDYETNKKLLIKLNEKISPSENVNKYFEKAKDEKVNYKMSVELFKFTTQKYNDLLEYRSLFEAMNDIAEIEKLHVKLIKSNKKKIEMDDGLKFKYLHYILDNKYDIYVGRDSKSNDYLSIKFAKQNDYWFHARGLPGSHVVLRVNNKEVVPKAVLKKTASLAAYYSKAKTAGTAPVSYTFAKFVYKKKGMEPGKVFLSKEKSLLVKPQIPNNCELVNE